MPELDDSLKAMGFEAVPQKLWTFDDIDQRLAPKAQAAVDQMLPKRIIPATPVNATGRITRISPVAATTPGSVRRNDFTFFFEKWEDTITIPQGHWTSWNVSRVVTGTFCPDPKLFNVLFGKPGIKVSAASEQEDEPPQGGFEATGPRDDFAAHMAHYGVKPGTPEWDAHARAWIDREDWKRQHSGEIMRASRLAVRDARIQQYRQSDADRLIEEMMQ